MEAGPPWPSAWRLASAVFAVAASASLEVGAAGGIEGGGGSWCGGGWGGEGGGDDGAPAAPVDGGVGRVLLLRRVPSLRTAAVLIEVAAVAALRQ